MQELTNLNLVTNSNTRSSVYKQPKKITTSYCCLNFGQISLVWLLICCLKFLKIKHLKTRNSPFSSENHRFRVFSKLTLNQWRKLQIISNTVYTGFCDHGFSGQSGYSDRNLVDGPPLLHNSDLGYNDLQFWPLCSKIATVNTFWGRYTQQSVVCIGFSDHLVVQPSENSLNLVTTIRFRDLDPRDGGWS